MIVKLRPGELSPGLAARRIGCTRGHVYYLLREGKLSVKRRDRAVGHCKVWLDEAEVDAFAASYDPHPTRARRSPKLHDPSRGEMAAILFPMFEARMTLAAIVVETKIAPATVREFYEEWMHPIEATSALRKRKATEEAELREQARIDKMNAVESYRAHKERLRRIETQAELTRQLSAPLRVGGIK